jgi:hypothetical protein
MKSHFTGEWFEDVLAGFTAYYLTSLPVFLGILFGVDFPSPAGVDSTRGPDLVLACLRSDALHYLDIIQHGYSYDPSQGSMVAFFPAYPLLSRWIGQATGLSPGEAALATANIALLGAFVLLTRYVRVRWPEATASQRGLVLAIFGLWPLGLFFRMPFTESLFVCGTLVVLYGMARGWPLLVLALLTGFVTAVRPVGMALTACFVWHVLTRPEIRPKAKAIQVVLLAPLACWGLLAYMGYQWLAFDTPWAFVLTQEHWIFLAPEDRTWLAKLWSLATLEPMWGVYMPGNRRYWGNAGAGGDPLFSLLFWNPILFLLAGALLAWGGRKRWLTGSEIVWGVALLAIPYVTRAFEMSMASHGRFAAVVVVNYLVFGRMLARSSPLALAALCSALALFLFTFTFLYTKDFPFF